MFYNTWEVSFFFPSSPPLVFFLLFFLLFFIFLLSLNLGVFKKVYCLASLIFRHSGRKMGIAIGAYICEAYICMYVSHRKNWMCPHHTTWCVRFPYIPCNTLPRWRHVLFRKLTLCRGYMAITTVLPESGMYNKVTKTSTKCRRGPLQRAPQSCEMDSHSIIFVHVEALYRIFRWYLTRLHVYI